MTNVIARSVAAGASALAGVAAGVITNKLTDEWTWTWAIGLAISTIVLITSQVLLTRSETERSVSATGRGSIAAGGSIDGDVEIETRGPAGPPGMTPSKGISALGSGAIAAGKNVNGKFRIRSTER